MREDYPDPSSVCSWTYLCSVRTKFSLILTTCRNADQLLPCVVYVAMKANPPNFFSELSFIEEFLDERSTTGMQGYTLTQFQVAYHYLIEQNQPTTPGRRPSQGMVALIKKLPQVQSVRSVDLVARKEHLDFSKSEVKEPTSPVAATNPVSNPVHTQQQPPQRNPAPRNQPSVRELVQRFQQ